MSEVFTPSPAYERMQRKRDLTETLWKGTEAMREAARRYHWMWPSEGEGKMVKAGPVTTSMVATASGSAGMVTRYELRIRESYLENYWLEGVLGAASMPFRRPWKVDGWHPLLTGSLVDGKLVKPGWLHNADRAGRTAEQMLYDALALAEAHGMDLILVDLPPATVPDSRRRPYWSGVRASKLLEAVVGDADGMPRLEVARIERTRTRRDQTKAWRPAEEPETIAKVYYAGSLDAAAGTDDAKVHCEIYDADGNFEETLVVEPPTGELRDIPLVPIYGGRTAPYEAEPPYYDQAEAQASHWRKKSRHDWKIRHIASTVLKMTGVNFDLENPGGGAGVDDDAIAWAADPAADIDYIETSGEALAALVNDLENVKKSIREGTMQSTLSRPSGDVTAFEIGVAAVRANSRIEADTVFLQASAAQLYEYTSILGGLSDRGSISIPHDFGIPQAGIENAAKLYEKGKLTPEGFLPVAKEAGWFPDNWSVEDEVQRLAASTQRTQRTEGVTNDQ